MSTQIASSSQVLTASSKHSGVRGSHLHRRRHGGGGGGGEQHEREQKHLEMFVPPQSKRSASEVVFRTFADQLRKTRVASNEGPNREANGITALAEMTVKEYDRAPGTVGTRDQLIVARLRSQLFRLISNTKRTRLYSESTTTADLPVASQNDGLSEEDGGELTKAQKKELVSFLFYGLHPESGRPITRERDVMDMLNASHVVPQKQVYTKWNWTLITDILNLSQADFVRAREYESSTQRRSSGRILVSPVIYKTKFLHRLGGFFQWTDTSEPGEFISQPWTQNTLKYSFAAHRWLRLLTSTREGRKFVSANGDRRGKLPISIVRYRFLYIFLYFSLYYNTHTHTNVGTCVVCGTTSNCIRWTSHE